jgi:A/G-specific adenine glycosylase
MRVQKKFNMSFVAYFLRTLRGVGPSTAAGILSFAWNKPYPMIDTNIRRILKRCFPAYEKSTDRELFFFAQSLIPKGKGRAWNYAMLDIGAMECTARNHHNTCPFLKLHGKILDKEQQKRTLPFKETKRYLRGQIVKQLVQKQKLSFNELRNMFVSSGHDMMHVLTDMKNDGLIRVTTRCVTLPKE